MQSASASGCSYATISMAARVFGPRPQEPGVTRPRVRARFNNPWKVERSCSGEGGSATIFPRLSADSPQKAYPISRLQTVYTVDKIDLDHGLSPTLGRQSAPSNTLSAVLGDLVQTTDGKWITRPPSRCPNGHHRLAPRTVCLNPLPLGLLPQSWQVEQVLLEPALEGDGLAILRVEVDDVILAETPDLIVVVQLAGEFM
jgi:hypothetical protein